MDPEPDDDKFSSRDTVGNLNLPVADNEVKDDKPGQEAVGEGQDKYKCTMVLLNPVVLAKVGPLLRAKDLLTLRETCISWNSSFIPALKGKHSPIRLNAWLEKEDGTQSSSSLGKFTQLMQSNLEIPYSKYEIISDNDWGFYKSKSLTSQEFKDFVSVCGNSLTSLRTKNIPGKDISTLEIWRLIFQEATNLKELYLQPQEVNGEELDLPQAKTIPNLQRLDISNGQRINIRGLADWRLLSDILQFATGLQHLALNISYHEEQETNPLQFQLLAQIREKVGSGVYALGNLKTLELLHVRAAEIQLLVDLATATQAQPKKNALAQTLRLEEFSVALICLDHGAVEDIVELAQQLHTFLGTQAETLGELKIGFENRVSNRLTIAPRFHIPRLPNLRSLELVRSEPHRIMISCDEHGLVPHNFPNLQRLSYIHQYVSRVNFMAGLNLMDDMNLFVHPGVRQLNLSLHAGNLARFAQFAGAPRFPAVQVVTVTINGANKPAEISSLFSNDRWPALTRLHIRLDFDLLTYPKFPDELRLDALLTGVPGHVVRAVKLELEGMQRESQLQSQPTPKSTSAMLDFFRGLLGKYKAGPGLGDLEHLQEFVLEVSPGNPFEFSDVGAYLIIAGLELGPQARPHLQRVTIRGAGKNQISEQCKKFMENVLASYSYIAFSIE